VRVWGGREGEVRGLGEADLSQLLALLNEGMKKRRVNGRLNEEDNTKQSEQ
jgi:hypothetical protein